MNLIFYKDDKLYIKKIKRMFFYAFNTIIKLFFTIVYLRIITLTLIFHDHPLVEYPLSLTIDTTFIQLDITGHKPHPTYTFIFFDKPNQIELEKVGDFLKSFTNNMCIPKCFNMSISHQLFDYTITFVYSQH